MTRYRPFFLFGLAPAMFGLIAWLAFRLGWASDSILYLRANLGLLLLLVGILLSLLIFAGLGLFVYFENRAQKQTEKILSRSSSEHRQFLQRLDHELKNPLTVLQVELANLKEEAAGPGGDDPVGRIHSQVSRLNDMVYQLRKLGDLQTNPIEQTPVKLEELLDDLVAEFSPTKPNITLNIPRMPWSLPEVRGDSDLLYLALRNVLSNAIKFTRPEDAIQVRAFEDTRHIVVEVADQGPGIPEDELPHVMQELYRGKNARGLPGSGLGLALVQAIVQEHGGEIDVRSRVHQGTVVSLRLPRM
jgi:two-component system, OmpR family, sensor kinase